MCPAWLLMCPAVYVPVHVLETIRVHQTRQRWQLEGDMNRQLHIVFDHNIENAS